MSIRAILVGVNYSNQTYDYEVSMKELKALAEACQIEVADVLTQKLDHIHPASFIGSGKIHDLRMMIESTQSNLVICSEELTPSQIVNLEDALGVEVTDRTSLILEIFASRAKTKEAKLQVEIATLRYMLPRLIGISSGIYGQQGGSGFRGGGETKLELDRRKVKQQITALEQELKEAVKQRQVQRQARKKSRLPIVALVGYTNSGKSTLMNRLLQLSDKEEKKVLAKNMLFATLETSTRSITLPDNKRFLVTDTVGFVDQLPHHLVKAFRSTLEEVQEADLLLHVIDASSKEHETQIDVTNRVLQEIGVKEIPMIYVYNKADISREIIHYRQPCIAMSALHDENIDGLLDLIKSQLFCDYQKCTMLLPYEEGGIYSYLKQHASILKSEETDQGYLIEAELHQDDYAAYLPYMI